MANGINSCLAHLDDFLVVRLFIEVHIGIGFLNNAKRQLSYSLINVFLILLRQFHFSRSKISCPNHL